MRTARARGRARPAAAGGLAGCGLLLLVASASFASSATLDTVVIPSVGQGYTVSSEGPLDPSQFAADAPDPAAVQRALSTLAPSVSTYQRVWRGEGGRNQVQDALVHFPVAAQAQGFLQAARHSVDAGEVVSSDPLPSVPGARKVTYFGAADRGGLGEAITMRAGLYVDLLSFFSAASGNVPPITPADAERVALAQHAALVAAPDGTEAASAGTGAKKGVSAGTIVVAVLAVAVLAVAVATPALLRRRRGAPVPATHVAPRPSPSDGDTVDDLREQSG